MHFSILQCQNIQQFLYIHLSLKETIRYAISGRLIIINGNRQILCQRDDPKFDIFKLFEVSSEDIQHIRALLDQTSIQNTEISLQLMAKVENKRQMYDLKLHTFFTKSYSEGFYSGQFTGCLTHSWNLYFCCSVYHSSFFEEVKTCGGKIQEIC